MIRHAMASLALAACALGAAAAWGASPPAVEAPDGMVVSSQHLASDAGAEILRAGGNAVDAAVATGYAQAVTNPCCANIGGGGFMVIHLAKDDRDTFLNFRETAPAAATRTMYLDAAGNPVKGASLYGYLAVGVPGSVLGLDTALQRYGTLPREQVMAPAIRLAREGFILTRGDTDILDAGAKLLKQDPVAAKIFFRPDGSAFKPGDRLVQADLADTLEAIAKGGPDAFYKGAVAQKVEAAMKAGGGVMTAQDFAAYTVTETAPVTCSYRGYEFVSSPPPSSGGTTMCEILNILEGYDLKALGWHSAAGVHLMIEAMRHAYMDRNTYLGDPAFVNNPLDRLLSKDYAAQIRTRILPDKATPSKEVQPGAAPHEKTETTHYSVVDKDGNAVSVTYTINGLFGAGVIAPGTGFLLNDEMDDFTSKPGVPNLFGLVQGEANAIAPGKRPLSSMSPTIVSRDGRPVMVIGTPGGSRIITVVVHCILNVVDYGMNIQEAIDAPRFHQQWLPETTNVDTFALSPDTRKILLDMGHKFGDPQPAGHAAGILVGAPSLNGKPRGKDRFYGANDPRRGTGFALGY